MAAILVGFAIWFVAHSASPVWLVVPAVLLCPGGFVIPCTVFAVRKFRDNTRKLKDLQGRLASLEAEERAGKSDELNRGAMEENGQ